MVTIAKTVSLTCSIGNVDGFRIRWVQGVNKKGEIVGIGSLYQSYYRSECRGYCDVMRNRVLMLNKRSCTYRAV